VILGLGVLGFLTVLLTPWTTVGWALVTFFLAWPFIFAAHGLDAAACALMAWLLGLRVFRVAVGTGETLWEARLGHTALEVRARFYDGGCCEACLPGTRLVRLRYVLAALAGPLANGALAVAVLSVGPRLATARTPTSLVVLVWLFAMANLLALGRALWPLGSRCKTLVRIPFLSPADVRRAHADYFLAEAMDCWGRKELGQAARWCERGLDCYPGDASLRTLLGFLPFEARDWQAARRAWAGLLDEKGLGRRSRARALNNLAVAALLEASAALAAARPAGMNPADSSGAGQEAELLRQADRWSQEAFQTFRAVPHYLGTRGCVLIERGMGPEGMDLLTEAMGQLKAPRDKAFCACYLALAEARLGHPEQADRHLEAARRLDPGCVALQAMAGRLAASRAAPGGATGPTR
jgi:hypothetical protein